MSVQAEWQRCRVWIEAAVNRSPGFETIEDVEDMIASGRYQFWPAKDCAVITRIDEFRRVRALMAVHGGGNLAALRDGLVPELEKWARINGFDYFGGEGREGWARTLKPKGYHVAFITMLKPLQVQ